MSCDLITDIPPHLIINTHRAQKNTMTCMLYEATNLDPPERINREDGEIIGIHTASSRLVLMLAAGDVKSGDQISLRTSLLTEFPNVQMHSHLRDAHLYVFKRWVLELLVKNHRLSSIKSDLVPLLLECQHRSAVVKREGIQGF